MDAIEVGESVARALDEAGDVRCWGSNTQGQLGIGTPDSRLVEEPAPVIGFGD